MRLARMISATDPLLDPLELNMGTFVHPLQGGSPAIDAGNNAAPTADQRGVARLDGDNNGSVISDIGAFETAFIPPVIDFSMATFSTLEGDVTNTTNVVMLTRMGTIATTSSVDVVLTGGSALAGTDFTAGPITVNFSAGQSTAMVPIELLGETVVELDETINLSLTNFVNSQAGTTQQTSALTIENDDSATISIGDATITEGGQLSFSVSITNPVDVNVTMDADTQDGTATTADSDYTALVNDPVSFSAGTTTTQTVIVQTTTDNKVELNETLLVILGSLNAGGRSVTFLDNNVKGASRTTILPRSPSAMRPSRKGERSPLMSPLRIPSMWPSPPIAQPWTGRPPRRTVTTQASPTETSNSSPPVRLRPSRSMSTRQPTTRSNWMR